MKPLARMLGVVFCLTLAACVTPGQGTGASTTAAARTSGGTGGSGATVRTPTPPASGSGATASGSGATGSGSGHTEFGFYGTAPDLTAGSRTRTLRAISRHADALLLQPEVPWAQFLVTPDGRSAVIDGLRATVGQARRAGLAPIIVVDPLKGLDRTRFAPLPAGLGAADFGTPQLRRAYRNFAVRISREFHPRYLGLGAEINTYAAAHPADFPNFVSLYRETYAAVKAQSPSTKVFVSFQWEGLNGLDPRARPANPGPHLNWAPVDAFEPDLDVLAISTYPYFVHGSAAQIPADYYAPLTTRTRGPLAISESGWPSEPTDRFSGSPADQARFLRTVHTQLGSRLAFWVNLMIDDLDVQAFDRYLVAHRLPAQGDTLRLFASLGLRSRAGAPKPALSVWDRLRTQ